MTRRTLLLVLFAAACSACSRPGSAPRSTAEAFLDAHYVRIDLAAAGELASGLARDKIDREIALTKDQAIDRETRQPRINYKLERADETETVAQYAYELTIRPPGMEPFAKLVTVTVRRAGDAWSVTNYSEGDSGEPPPPGNAD